MQVGRVEGLGELSAAQGPEPAKTGHFGKCGVSKFWDPGGFTFEFQSFGTRVGPGFKVLKPGWVQVPTFCYPGGSGFGLTCAYPVRPRYDGRNLV